MRFTPDPWLASILGYDVYRVTFEQAESLDARAIFPAGLPARAFHFTKVPTRSVAQVNTLTQAGFQVIDVNVVFERTASQVLPRVNDSFIVRDARPPDRDAVLEIAATCFVYSRFHLDPQIPKDVAAAIKREWIASYFDGRRGERLLIAECGGRPAGFLAVLSIDEGHNPIHVIDLVGVDKAYQRQGVGASLIQSFINTYAGRSHVLRVGTQAANIPSMRLYEHFGFSIVETMYVLHAHVLNGELVR